MASSKPITAIVARLRSKAKQPKKASYEWISFSTGAAEVSQSLAISYETAVMTLYGLCATGNVRSCNKHGKVIDAEECTIEHFEGAVADASVSAADLRHWLSERSSAPQLSHRKAVIASMLKAGAIPGSNIHWKTFCDDVRDKCNGWLSKADITKHRPGRGFDDKTIQRDVKELRQR